MLGCVAAYSALRLRRERWIWLLPSAWAVSTLCFLENLVPIIRLLGSDPAPLDSRRPGSLRVVALNCAGNPAAAAEVGALKPEIVLLQEIPSTNQLARLAHEWFGDTGSFLAGFDCAILARGAISNTDSRLPPQHTRAVVYLQNMPALLVTSLRLVPPVGRFDLWNPEAWRAAADNRRLRRRQLQAVLEREPPRTEMPEVFGGDFNAPVPDAIFKLMGHFHDAYRESGRGWGNTALNNMPIARPDQIWLKGLHAVSARAIRTQYSDHRLVVADIELPH